ncbi:hypothetical protein [Amniculibacterium sp. G2-70]|uniref:hypothetical protein n=1 Tax=Amniculibacterium sp. G2-70 TaxID=2767188 RepID=UPI0016540BBF|nr:hypothetical protein [Amniculibacterium sp. G2-70]
MIFRSTLIFLLSISIHFFSAQTYKIRKTTGKLSEYSSYKSPNFTMEYGYYGYKYQPAILEINYHKTNLTELIFLHNRSSLYTRKIMFDKFGLWDKEIKIDIQPILIWENKKLFNDSDQLFTIIARGFSDYNFFNHSSSVMVLDKEGKDCLKEGNPLRDKITYFFSEGYHKLKDSKFLDVYKKSLQLQRQALAKKYNITPTVGDKMRIPQGKDLYIYDAGYNGIDLIKVENKETNSSFHELIFSDTHSSSYTVRVMMKNWTDQYRQLKPNDFRHSISQWSNIKLLKGVNELFTVFAFGIEDYDTIHSSVLVFDKDGKDCLADESPYQEKIIQYFAEEIKKLEKYKMKSFRQTYSTAKDLDLQFRQRIPK